jgi:flagellar hook assembly protein FlgD
VKTLLSRNMPAGSFIVTWDGTNEEGSQVANGIYFYRIVAGDFSKTLKMTFMKYYLRTNTSILKGLGDL